MDIGIYISGTSTFEWRQNIKIHWPHNHVPKSTNWNVNKSLNKVVTHKKDCWPSEKLFTIFEVDNSSLDADSFFSFNRPSQCLRTKAPPLEQTFFFHPMPPSKGLGGGGRWVRLAITHWSRSHGFGGVEWCARRTAPSGAHPPTVGGRKRSPPITVKHVRVAFYSRSNDDRAKKYVRDCLPRESFIFSFSRHVKANTIANNRGSWKDTLLTNFCV